ncbi:MAG: hypothetical protein ACP5SI_12160 [Chloroflexia bacterium]
MSHLWRLLLLLCLLALPLGCGAAPRLSYTVGPCEEQAPAAERQNHVEISSRGSELYIEQDVAYVCCARIALHLERAGDLLKVIETNEGEVCRCMCAYHVSARVHGLAPGRYRVQVWGIRYRDVHPLELLGEETVQL